MTNRDHEGTPPFEKTRLCPSPYLYQEGAILCMELQIHPTIQNQSARETLENQARLRDNHDVIASQDWVDGRQTAGFLRLRAVHGKKAH